MQNDVLATGIMSFVMHEIIYFGRSMPFLIMDHIPWFRRYKIQNVSRASRLPEHTHTRTCTHTYARACGAVRHETARHSRGMAGSSRSSKPR